MLVDAVLGVATRSSSAVLVVVGGPPGTPRLLVRRRIELVPGDLPAQVYHAAAGRSPDAAAALVDRWADTAVGQAARALAEVGREVADAGGRLAAVGLVGEVRDLPPLPAILRSHPLLHAAEGQLSRDVVADAAATAGLAVHRFPPDQLRGGVPGDPVVELGRAAGPPWRKEHKLAAYAALATFPVLPPR